MKPSDFTGDPVTDDDAASLQHELLIDRSGKVRQAGASTAEGEFVQFFKLQCEQNLYVFLTGVLNYYWMEPSPHQEVCDWLTTFPTYRKMLLMPRDHCKTTMVGRGVPLHAIIQPKDNNLYFPGDPGNYLRCLMAGETETRSVENMRVLIHHLENNLLLRALWPHVCWENPRRQSKKWSEEAIIIPRDTEFAEPTIKAIGVGGAVTGMHPNMILKDDLTTRNAANEPSTMQNAIKWHQDSRALFSHPETDIEIITATYWAAYDLPHFIEENDKAVTVNKKWRAMEEDGKILYPMKFGFEGAVEQIKREHPEKWPFLYFNTIHGSGLTDFNLADIRYYELRDGNLCFEEGDQDAALYDVHNPEAPAETPHADRTRGMPLNIAIDLGLLSNLRNMRGG